MAVLKRELIFSIPPSTYVLSFARSILYPQSYCSLVSHPLHFARQLRRALCPAQNAARLSAFKCASL